MYCVTYDLWLKWLMQIFVLFVTIGLHMIKYTP